MDITRDTLVVRAARYKRLVIAVSLLVVGVILVAMPLFGWRAAGILLLLPSLVLGFFAQDFAQVCRWRDVLLAEWAAGSMRLDLAASTLRQMPAVPPDTVDGMLRCLPACPAPCPDARQRQALWEAQAELGRLAVRSLRRRSAVALVAGSATAAALWWPSASAAAIAVVGAALAAAAIGSGMTRRRLRHLHQTTSVNPESADCPACDPSLEGFSKSSLKAWR